MLRGIRLSSEPVSATPTRSAPTITAEVANAISIDSGPCGAQVRAAGDLSGTARGRHLLVGSQAGAAAARQVSAPPAFRGASNAADAAVDIEVVG